jgi:hypothetical protein
MYFEVVSSSVTAPGSSGSPMVAISGDQLTVKNAEQTSRVELLTAWSKVQGAGWFQIVFPSGNDTTRNIRTRTTVGIATPRLPLSGRQALRPQELMSWSLAGSSTAGDVELLHALLWYHDLPGLNMRLIDWDELQRRAARTVSVEDTVTPTSAASYSGARSLTAGSDLLRANTDYALVGGVVGTLAGALCLRGPDFANGRVAIPCEPTRPDLTCNFFEFLSYELSRPMIPVFNSANKSAMISEIVQDENLASVPFAWNLVELSPS